MVPPLCSGYGLFVSHSLIVEEGEDSRAFRIRLSLSIRRPTSDIVLILLRVETGSNRSKVFELCASFPAVGEGHLFRPMSISPAIARIAGAPWELGNTSIQASFMQSRQKTVCSFESG